MQRQVYGRNPATGRVEHYYKDEGAAGVAYRPSIAAPKTTSHNWGGRKVRPAKGV